MDSMLETGRKKVKRKKNLGGLVALKKPVFCLSQNKGRIKSGQNNSGRNQSRCHEEIEADR